LFCRRSNARQTRRRENQSICSLFVSDHNTNSEESGSEYDDDDGDEAVSTQKSPVNVRDNGNMPSPSLLPYPSPRAFISTSESDDDALSIPRPSRRACVTSSENDDDAVRVPTPAPAKQFFYGKNRKKWSATEPVWTPQHNIALNYHV
jgi:hypothetical protein